MTGEGRERLKRYLEQDDVKKAAQRKVQRQEQEAVQGFLEAARSKCIVTVKPAMEEATALFTGPDRSAGVYVREGEGFFDIELVVAIDRRNSRLTFSANTRSRKVDVNRAISGPPAQTVDRHPPSEITDDVVQKHIDNFLGGLIPQR